MSALAHPPGTPSWADLQSPDAEKARAFYELWPAEIPPHWMAYFGVADTDAAVQKVLDLGGKQLVPAFDSPYGRLSVVADPMGAIFTIIKAAGPAQA